MSDLRNYRPNKDNKGLEIKAVRCDTHPMSFESLYNVYTTFKEEHPNQTLIGSQSSNVVLFGHKNRKNS